MIVNIRGTSGSGKSTLIRNLFDRQPGGMEKWMGKDPTRRKTDDVILGYMSADRRVGVPGKYVTACGGCDAIATQDETQRRVRELSQMTTNVVFEGLLISHIYGRWAEMARSEYPGAWVFAFLDTPLEVCLERVGQRRKAGGNEKPLNPANTVQKWHDSRSVAEKAARDGFRVVWLPWESPLPTLESLLT